MLVCVLTSHFGGRRKHGPVKQPDERVDNVGVAPPRKGCHHFWFSGTSQVGPPTSPPVPSGAASGVSPSLLLCSWFLLLRVFSREPQMNRCSKHLSSSHAATAFGVPPANTCGLGEFGRAGVGAVAMPGTARMAEPSPFPSQTQCFPGWPSPRPAGLNLGASIGRDTRRRQEQFFRLRLPRNRFFRETATSRGDQEADRRLGKVFILPSLGVRTLGPRGADPVAPE